MDERGEHDVELLEAGEDAAEALEATEQPLDFVASPVDGFAVVPSRVRAVRVGRDNRREAQIKGQLPRLVAFVGPIHDQMQVSVRCAQHSEQLASLGRVASLARRQRKRYGRSSIRGNHMNLGGPAAAGLADRLRAVFFSAPVPSGCTLTMVLSNATDSILMRTI